MEINLFKNNPGVGRVGWALNLKVLVSGLKKFFGLAMSRTVISF